MRFGTLFLAGALTAAQLPEARRAELAGDLPAAESAYERELATSQSAEIWQRLGLVRHLQNKFESAIPAFRNAIRLDASLWTSHLFLGICLYRTNHFAEAVRALESAEKLAARGQPGRDEVDFWLGAARIGAKQPLKGLQALEQLLSRNPRRADALELATKTYAELSANVWNDVAERHFESAAGQEVHGQALESEGNRGAAIEAFRASKALAPRRAGPGLAIARLLLRDGKAEEALHLLKEELSLADAGHLTSYYAGLAALRLNRHAEAAPYLEAAAVWPEANPDALLALAQTYLTLKDSAKAADAGRRAVTLHPDSAAAHEIYVAALGFAGDAQAIEAEKLRWKQRGGR